MKLVPITKLDKRSTSTSKKLDDGFMSANYVVIIIFSELLKSPPRQGLARF